MRSGYSQCCTSNLWETFHGNSCLDWAGVADSVAFRPTGLNSQWFTSQRFSQSFLPQVWTNCSDLPNDPCRYLKAFLSSNWVTESHFERTSLLWKQHNKQKIMVRLSNHSRFTTNYIQLADEDSGVRTGSKSGFSIWLIAFVTFFFSFKVISMPNIGL